MACGTCRVANETDATLDPLPLARLARLPSAFARPRAFTHSVSPPLLSPRRDAPILASVSLLVLGGWLLGLGHAVGKHGPEWAFRFAPWPLLPLLAAAGWMVRRARADEPDGDGTPAWRGARSTGAVVAIGLAAYVSTWTLAFLDPEDWYHLILVRHATRHGIETALADAWTYLRGHPGMFIRTGQFAVWYVEDVVFRGWSPGYRIAGLALHITTALLVERAATRVGLPRTAAWIAALSFAANPASRALVRDPTGLSELMLGALYVAALLAWLPSEPPPARRPPAPAWWRYGLLGALILTRDLAFTFPFVLAALTLGRALDAAPRAAPGPRAALAHAWRISRAALVVPAVQGALLLGELVLDPTSGRPRPAHPLGEFGQFAEGLGLSRVVAAFLRDLPRNVLFPVWDKDPEAHFASWVVVMCTLWLVIGLRASRRHHGATLGAAAWTAAPMALVFPFTTWEGPDNAHLLYLSTAGLALLVASVWAALPRGASRTLSSAGLAVGLACAMAFHLGRAPAEELQSERMALASRWLATIDGAAPPDNTVLLVGGNDAGGDRWKAAVLAIHAERSTWRQRFVTVDQVWWTGAASGTRGVQPTVAGFDGEGRALRWHSGQAERIEGLHVGELPPAGCRPISDAGELAGFCAVEPASTYRTLREVLLTM